MVMQSHNFNRKQVTQSQILCGLQTEHEGSMLGRTPFNRDTRRLIYRQQASRSDVSCRQT